jgi:hypothetical protein
MNMAVDKVSWLENLHEPKVGFKAPMALVVFIMYALRRGMGKEYIHKPAVENAVPQKPGDERCRFQKHLKIRILIIAVIITHRPAEARYYEVFFNFYLCSNMNRAAAKIVPFLYLQGGIPDFPEVL